MPIAACISVKEKLKPITGSPPSLIDLPRDCAFKKRCAFKNGNCSGDYPPLVEIETGHFAACYRAGDLLKDRIQK